MLNNRYDKQPKSDVRILLFFALASLLSLCLFAAGSEAATYYVQPDNTTNIGIDGTCNLASGQVNLAPTVRTTFDPAGNGATGSSYRPTTGMSNGNWTVLMRVYGPVYSANAVDISAVTAAKFSIRGYNATDQWTFHLYDYNPAGTAGNKTLVATSQTITSGTGGTVAVNPTYTISGTGRMQQNHRLLLEIAYMPGGTTYTPRVYYDTTGTTTESFVTVTETPVIAGDTLTASGNTAIAAVNPIEGTAGILMQRFQVSSNNVQNGQIELSSLNLTDSGNATSILDAKVYISATSSSTLPAGAVLIGSTGTWNGNATAVTLNGGTAADRTVSTVTPKFIYMVYDLAAGQTGNTIQSSVTDVGVAAPDISAGNAGTSNLLTIQPCSDPDPSTITIPASQTAYGNPYDISGMFNTTGDVGSFEYKVTTGGGAGVVTGVGSWISSVDTNPTSYTVPAGTNRVLIVAVGIENSTGTISVSGVTFGGQAVTPIAQIGDGGTGYNNYVWFGYCNEACIAAAGGGAQNIQVTSSATLNNIVISSGTYQNVNQATPAYATGTNSTAASPISVTVNNPDGGRVLFGVNFNGQTNSLNALTGYTEMFDTPTNTSGAGNGFSFAVAERNATTTATPENITATASAASSRTNIVAVSLNPAAGETICTSPEWTTNPSIPTSGACAPYVETADNYNLYVRGTDPDCGTAVISSPASRPFTWNLNAPDVTAPTVTAFTATSPSNSLNIPVTSFTATDNIAVTGYMITTSATPPLAGDAGWTGTAPATFTVATDGTYTLYPWAKDAAGNVSAVFATPGTVVVDTTAPAVSSTIPASGATGVALNSSVTITWNENVNCSTVNTTNITISGGTLAFSSCSANQAVFTTGGQVNSTPYTVTVSTAVTDSAGNPMSASYPFSFTTIAAPDVTAPTVTVFTATSPSNSLNIPITSFTATDNIAVTGYMITTSATPPLAGDAGWTGTAPATFTVATDGTYTLYPWAKDAAGNVSAVFATPGTVIVDTTAPSYTWNSPATGMYYKDGASIAIDALVTETGSGITSGANCNPKIDGTGAGFTGIIYYSSISQKCSGTITLNSPSGLIDGAHSLTLEVIDLAGNSAPGTARNINIDNTRPSSDVTSPLNGATLNSSSPDPYSINGTSTDNRTVSSVEISINGNAWTTASCTGCPGTNVIWSYNWTLPADGTYSIRSRATDSTGNIEVPGTGISVTVSKTGPSVTSTVPSNGAVNVTLNSSVTIYWTENVDCTTVNTTNVYINTGGWALSGCSGSQAVFSTSGQATLTTYLITVTTGVRNSSGNPMATPYGFSYTTGGPDIPTLSYPAYPYNNGADPDTGNTTTDFTFKIIYTDLQNDAPAAGYPMIFIGDNDGYYGYTMSEENPLDTNHADGKTYYFRTGFGASEDLRYFFEARAATGNTGTVNLPTTAPGYHAGPAVYLLPGYNLVGVPKNLSCNCNSYLSVLGDDSGYQYCLSWDSFGPDPAGGSWLDNTYGMLYTGRGYDIYSDGGPRRLDEPAGATQIGNDPRPYIDINLDSNGGWSVITNPYNAFIKLQDIMVVRSSVEYSYAQAVGNGWISNSIYEWEGDGPGYAFKAFNGSQPAVLEPWVGYFIHVFDTVPTRLRIYAP